MKIFKNRYYLISMTGFIIFFSAVLTIIPSCKYKKTLPSSTIRDVSYGPDKENTMDISLPENRTAATPVIILIHGGAWTGGDKNDLSFLREYFSDRGFAVFSANYRLAAVEGTGLKNILDDIGNAVEYVRNKSSYWTYSPGLMFIAGYSAGGHIALLYSFSSPPRSSVRGVISYCGLSDLTDPELEIFLKRMQRNELSAAKRSFDRIGFIAGPDRNARIGYSPRFITRDIPVLLFCGKKDIIIPWSQSENLHKKMKERGFDSTLYVYPDMGHDMTPYYGEIVKITEQWMRDRI